MTKPVQSNIHEAAKRLLSERESKTNDKKIYVRISITVSDSENLQDAKTITERNAASSFPDGDDFGAAVIAAVKFRDLSNLTIDRAIYDYKLKSIGEVEPQK